MVLSVGLIVAGSIQNPDPVMPQRRFRTHVETGQLPSPKFLEDGSKGIRSFVTDEVLNHDGISPCGQTGNVKLGAIGGLAAATENTAIEAAILARFVARIQQERGAELSARAGKSCFVVVDGAADPGEVCLQRGNGVRFKTSDVTTAGLVENQLGRALARRA